MSSDRRYRNWSKISQFSHIIARSGLKKMKNQEQLPEPLWIHERRVCSIIVYRTIRKFFVRLNQVGSIPFPFRQILCKSFLESVFHSIMNVHWTRISDSIHSELHISYTICFIHLNRDRPQLENYFLLRNITEGIIVTSNCQCSLSIYSFWIG